MRQTSSLGRGSLKPSTTIAIPKVKYRKPVSAAMTKVSRRRVTMKQARVKDAGADESIFKGESICVAIGDQFL